VIRVERSMDHKGATITPKSDAGRRSVPIPGVLRDLLVSHNLATWADGLVFGSSHSSPFPPTAVHRRARLRWQNANLEQFGLHEARHTFASMMIAADVNAKALSTYMGHSSITITLDRYGHLMPGNESGSCGAARRLPAKGGHRSANQARNRMRQQPDRDQARALRCTARARAAMLRSADAFHQSVIAAHQAGCSVRQIAERVGMSHQRIHQIVSNT
jgi:hypothetical protein